MRRWWIIGAVVLVTVSTVVVIFLVRAGGQSDCETVRELLDYNKSQSKQIAGPSEPTMQQEAGIGDYEEWAQQVERYAARITDPALEGHAQRFADLANETVAVVKEARAETQQSLDRGVPGWVEDYANIEAETRTELGALDSKCPA